MAQAESDYPVQFSVDYPDRDLNRLTTFFRIFTVIPIAIVLFAVSGGASFSWAARDETYVFGAGAGGILFLAPLLLIVFRQKYPRWWFDWPAGALRFRSGRDAVGKPSSGVRVRSHHRPLPAFQARRVVIRVAGPGLSLQER